MRDDIAYSMLAMKADNTFAERSKEVRQSMSLSQAKFAARLGVSRALPSKWESGEIQNPKRKHLVAMATESGYRIEYLMDGELPRKLTSELSREEAQALGKRPAIIEWEDPSDLPDDEYVFIARRIRIGLGNGQIVVEEEDCPPFPLKISFLKKIGAKKSDLLLAQGKGDSMAPYISDGDYAVIHKRKTEIVEGTAYGLLYNDELKLKYVFKHYTGGLILRSENIDAFPDELIPKDALQAGLVEILGKIVYRAG